MATPTDVLPEIAELSQRPSYRFSPLPAQRRDRLQVQSKILQWLVYLIVGMMGLILFAFMPLTGILIGYVIYMSIRVDNLSREVRLLRLRMDGRYNPGGGQVDPAVQALENAFAESVPTGVAMAATEGRQETESGGNPPVPPR